MNLETYLKEKLLLEIEHLEEEGYMDDIIQQFEEENPERVIRCLKIYLKNFEVMGE